MDTLAYAFTHVTQDNIVEFIKEKIGAIIDAFPNDVINQKKSRYDVVDLINDTYTVNEYSLEKGYRKGTSVDELKLIVNSKILKSVINAFGNKELRKYSFEVLGHAYYSYAIENIREIIMQIYTFLVNKFNNTSQFFERKLAVDMIKYAYETNPEADPNRLCEFINIFDVISVLESDDIGHLYIIRKVASSGMLYAINHRYKNLQKIATC